MKLTHLHTTPYGYRAAVLGSQIVIRRVLEPLARIQITWVRARALFGTRL